MKKTRDLATVGLRIQTQSTSTDMVQYAYNTGALYVQMLYSTCTTSSYW